MPGTCEVLGSEADGVGSSGSQPASSVWGVGTLSTKIQTRSALWRDVGARGSLFCTSVYRWPEYRWPGPTRTSQVSLTSVRPQAIPESMSGCHCVA